jgi:hypothetical protein
MVAAQDLHRPEVGAERGVAPWPGRDRHVLDLVAVLVRPHVLARERDHDVLRPHPRLQQLVDLAAVALLGRRGQRDLVEVGGRQLGREELHAGVGGHQRVDLLEAA